LVAAALKGSIQPGLDYHLCKVDSHDPGPQREHIGIVVHPGQLGGVTIRTDYAADPLYLVGGKGDSDSGPTDDNCPLTFTGSNKPGGFVTPDWIIRTFRTIGAKIQVWSAKLFQQRDNFFPEAYSGMIGRYCYHCLPPFFEIFGIKPFPQ
jgi:hypothetical protein